MAAVVHLQGLSKSFGAVRAVDRLELTIASGEIVAMLGPNGAGKSTTNELILGLISPDAGQVRVFGGDPRHAVRQGMVGAMLQGGALLQDATVQQVLQLMHGLHRHPLPLAEIIERAGVSSFLRTRTDKLSGGQAQRLRYALAIMPDPGLLILDEPTVSMDVDARRNFWESMRDFVADGRTVLFATHYLDEADDVAGRIVVLSEGVIVADGSGAAIKSRVAGRTVSFAAESADPDLVRRLPGAVTSEVLGSRAVVQSIDSDATLRALLDRCPNVRDIEVTSTTLEDAFLALTAQESG
jgi:ABC-2 type transport system ATP-binding protein